MKKQVSNVVVDMSGKDASSSERSTFTRSTEKTDYPSWYSDSDEESTSCSISEDDTQFSSDQVTNGGVSTASTECEPPSVSEESELEPPKEEEKKGRGIFAVLNPSSLPSEVSKPLAAHIIEAQGASHHQLEDLLLKVAAKDEDLAANNELIIKLQQDIVDLKTKSASAEALAMSQANEKISHLKEENAVLSGKLEAAYKAVEESSKTSTSFAEITARGVAQKELAQREAEVAACKVTIKVLEERVKCLAKADEEIQSLKHSLEQMEKEKSTLFIENRRLIVCVSSAEQHHMNTDLIDQLSCARDEVELSQSKLLELRSVLKDLEMKHSGLVAEVSEHEEHRTFLESKVRLLEFEINRLNGQLQESKKAYKLLVDKHESPRPEVLKKGSVLVVPALAVQKKKSPKKKVRKATKGCSSDEVFLAALTAEQKSQKMTGRRAQAATIILSILFILSFNISLCGPVQSRTTGSGNPVCSATWTALSFVLPDLAHLQSENEALYFSHQRLDFQWRTSKRNFQNLLGRADKERSFLANDAANVNKYCNSTTDH